MEVRRQRSAQKRQAWVPIAPAKISQNLVICAIFFYDVNHVVDLLPQEVHHRQVWLKSRKPVVDSDLEGKSQQLERAPSRSRLWLVARRIRSTRRNSERLFPGCTRL